MAYIIVEKKVIEQVCDDCKTNCNPIANGLNTRTSVCYFSRIFTFFLFLFSLFLHISRWKSSYATHSLLLLIMMIFCAYCCQWCDCSLLENNQRTVVVKKYNNVILCVHTSAYGFILVSCSQWCDVACVCVSSSDVAAMWLLLWFCFLFLVILCSYSRKPCAWHK